MAGPLITGLKNQALSGTGTSVDLTAAAAASKKFQLHRLILKLSAATTIEIKAGSNSVIGSMPNSDSLVLDFTSEHVWAAGAANEKITADFGVSVTFGGQSTYHEDVA